ncbi:MAG: competence/damage-inducible protein A [Alphaproteobacteria bacterium]|nr:competence/damage-inducible protein A [Alphaproteobacteria bacterium]
MTQEQPTAALLIIGNEILCGRTVDKNIAFLTKALFDLGIEAQEVRIVKDTFDAIIHAVNALRKAHTYVFTTGGIGPTHDDITAEAMAKAFGLPFEEHAEASAILLNHYGDQYTQARRRMAMMPRGAHLLPNPASSAPGFYVENVYVMAGVPSIMQGMFALLGSKLTPGDPIFTETMTFYIAESMIADTLRSLQEDNPVTDIGSYPFFKNNQIGTSILVRSRDKNALDHVMKALMTISES